MPSSFASRAARILVALPAAFFACTSDPHPAGSSLDVPGSSSGTVASTGTTKSTTVDSGATPKDCDAGTTTGGDCVLDCADGETKCNASCSDLTADTGNCGGCGQACGSLQVCYSGVCTAGCPSGTVVCAGKCVEPNADPKHCGATLGCGEDGGSAGRVCGTSQACYGSQCLADCPNNGTMCGTRCTDTTTDSANCGSCGHRCGSGKTCSGQICCATGYVGCNGQCVVAGSCQ